MADRAVTTRQIRPANAVTDRWIGRSLVVAGLLVALALVVPVALGWSVHAVVFAPLSAVWRPRIGIGSPLAVIVAVLVATRAIGVAEQLRWRVLVASSYAVSLAWSLSLALVDGPSGISAVFENHDEYLITAHHVGSVSTLLHTFVQRIPADAPGSWTTHVAGHPPGALLFFVALVRLGLGGGLASGLVVTVLGATTVIAVALTVDRAVGRTSARRATPFLAVGPFAIWSAVSADALFAAVVAWSVCALTFAATSRSRLRTHALGLVAGLLFGCALLLSYGLVVAGLLLVGALIVGRTWRPVPSAIAGIVVVVGAFAVAGFRWWTALPVLHDRYYAGIAHIRPASYWVWGDLAALTLSAGFAVAPAVAMSLRRWRPAVTGSPAAARALVVLPLAAVCCVAAADGSLMSKAEVERIWLPFIPWLLVGIALVPRRWRCGLMVAQVTLALAVQSLLFTVW